MVLTTGEQEMLSLCGLLSKELRGLLDPRFRLTKFVLDYSTGNVFGNVDYIPEVGKKATCLVELEMDQLSKLTRDQIVDYVRMKVQFANDSLVDFVDGDEFDGQ